MKLLFSFLFLILLSLCFGQPQERRFNAQVTGYFPNGRSQDPKYFTMEGQLNYDDTAVPNPQQRIIWDLSRYYPPNRKVYSYVRFTNLAGGGNQNIAFTVCPAANKCSAQTITEGRPEFYFTSRHNSASSGSGKPFIPSGCNSCQTDTTTQSQSSIRTKTVCRNAASLACWVEFFDGTIYVIENHATYTTFGAPPESTVTGVSSCPAPTCAPDLDMLYVVDVSGSISAANYVTATNFLMNLANSFTFYTAASGKGMRIAVVQFGTNVYIQTNAGQVFVTSSSAVSQMLNRRESGVTNTGGAMVTANQVMNQHSRSGVARIMLVITDGNCYPSSNCNGIGAQSNIATSNGITVLAVGVGSGISQNRLNEIACGSLSGPCDRVFSVSSFSALNSLLTQIVGVSCGEVTTTCACQTSFCACGDCVCPSYCHDGTTKCVAENCVLATGQCQYSSNATSCNALNLCKTWTCNAQTGCVEGADVNCNDNNPCTLDQCLPSSGCLHPDNTVTYCATQANPTVATNACQDAVCNPSTGTCSADPKPCNNCQSPCGCTSNCEDKVCPDNFGACLRGRCDQAQACDAGNELSNCIQEPVVCAPAICFDAVCNAAAGDGSCIYTPKNCSDGNFCTKDECVNDACVNTPYTQQEIEDDLCNDGNPCTIDTCSSVTNQCVHTPKSCSQFNTPCQNGLCRLLDGECYNQTIDCVQDLINRGIPLGKCHEARCSEVPRVGDKVVDGKVLKDQVLDPGCYAGFIQVADESTCERKTVQTPDNITETYLDCSNAKNITQDACGVCNGDGSSCGLSIAAIAGIAAGVLAAIIIAVIIAVAIISAISGKVAMDFYKKYKGNMGASQTNPLYENQGEGRNPLYEE